VVEFLGGFGILLGKRLDGVILNISRRRQKNVNMIGRTSGTWR
jgi:hypothetical protein